MTKRKQKPYTPIILSAFVLFSIITISQGSYRNGFGGSGFLLLQPTAPRFPSVDYSAYFAYQPFYAAPTFDRVRATSLISVDYTPVVYPKPSFQAMRPTPIVVSYAAPARPIFFTPSRALFEVDYRYSNVGRIW